MFPVAHIANTNVEFEWENEGEPSLEKSFLAHPICQQLQFLPLLYAEKKDVIAVTAYPDDSFMKHLEKMEWFKKGLPQIALLKETKPFQKKSCLSWGASQQVKAWADEREMFYQIPDWSIVKSINSKTFSFRYSSLNDAQLINDEEILKQWLNKNQNLKVLKTCYGLSGRGNKRISNHTSYNEILKFCLKEWKKKLPLIGEPWLDRTCDFSTQWRIHPDQLIEFVGAVRFDTDSTGTYLGTLAGPEEMLFIEVQHFLEEHKKAALQALKDIADMGFFGSIGIDAFLYRSNDKIHLNPIVEINGRQTMSLAALLLQRRICPDKMLRMSYTNISSNDYSDSLLPFKLNTFQFSRQLIAQVI